MVLGPQGRGSHIHILIHILIIHILGVPGYVFYLTLRSWPAPGPGGAAALFFEVLLLPSAKAAGVASRKSAIRGGYISWDAGHDAGAPARASSRL